MSVKSTDCTLESLPFEISEPEEKSDSKSTIGGAGGQSSAAGGGQEAAAAGGREKVLTEAELNSLAAKIVKVFFHCSATSKEYFVSFSAIFSPLVILNISIVSQNLWDGKDFAIPVPWDGKVFAIPGMKCLPHLTKNYM